MTEEACNNCRFWRYFATRDVGNGQGERSRGHCRRNPPRVIVIEEEGARTTFPLIAADDWCGKHEPSREKLAADARDAQIKREAGKLLTAARAAVEAEAEAGRRIYREKPGL